MGVWRYTRNHLLSLSKNVPEAPTESLFTALASPVSLCPCTLLWPISSRCFGLGIPQQLRSSFCPEVEIASYYTYCVSKGHPLEPSLQKRKRKGLNSAFYNIHMHLRCSRSKAQTLWLELLNSHLLVPYAVNVTLNQ